jgi:hypothetical protein
VLVPDFQYSAQQFQESELAQDFPALCAAYIQQLQQPRAAIGFNHILSLSNGSAGYAQLSSASLSHCMVVQNIGYHGKAFNTALTFTKTHCRRAFSAPGS